jgi:hypothetical protein
VSALGMLDVFGREFSATYRALRASGMKLGRGRANGGELSSDCRRRSTI